MRILILAVLTATLAVVNLGDTTSQAKARGKAYESQFGAIAPMFNTNANGRINWECWAAPAELWTMDQAKNFAQRLIPRAMASKSPKKGAIDGVYEPYFYPDGTVVIFQVMRLVIPGLKGTYLGVEVQSPSYDGLRC